MGLHAFEQIGFIPGVLCPGTSDLGLARIYAQKDLIIVFEAGLVTPAIE